MKKLIDLSHSVAEGKVTFHRYAEGKDLAKMPLESVAELQAVVCRVKHSGRAVGLETFKDMELSGKAVLGLNIGVRKDII